MVTVLIVKLWGKDVAAITWNKDKGVADLEFFESFVKEGLDISPLVMPLEDIKRGDRVGTPILVDTVRRQ